MDAAQAAPREINLHVATVAGGPRLFRLDGMDAFGIEFEGLVVIKPLAEWHRLGREIARSSATPRTDAAAKWDHEHYVDERGRVASVQVVRAEFARQLERELMAQRSAILSIPSPLRQKPFMPCERCVSPNTCAKSGCFPPQPQNCGDNK